MAKGNDLTWKFADDAAIAMEVVDGDSLKLQQKSSADQRLAEVHRQERSQPVTCSHWQTTCYS